MYWLIKSEPKTWSWDDQVRELTTKWDGVRNYQARNNLRQMQAGDLCFFYHSAIKDPAIVGIVRVIETYKPEGDAPNFGYVTVAFHANIQNPIFLHRIKNTPGLEDFQLLKQSRLSVMPVTSNQWDALLKMANSSC